MRYEAMERLKFEHSVRKMANVLGVKEAAFYQWRKRQQNNLTKQAEEEKLIAKVRKVFEDHERIYGYRSMKRALEAEEIYLSEYKVRQIMRTSGMYPESYKKYRPAKSGKANGRYLENLLSQDFKTSRLNEKWAGDITYIKTKVGWVYMACIIDLHNKEIVGYEIAKRADTELVCRALSYALVKRNITDKSALVFHSDRGIQYASKRFQKMLELNDVKGSMSRAGCPFDNAPTECFISIAKRERIYRKDYLNIFEVRRDLFDYIEVFYNRKRIQRGLGYVSPLVFRQEIEARRAA